MTGKQNDAVAVSSGTLDLRQGIVEPFSVYIIAPTKESLAAVTVVDVMYEEVAAALIKSLVGHRFDTGLVDDAISGVSFVGHGGFAYTKAYYVHKYDFEIYKELTLEDTVYGIDSGQWPTVAFRDIVINLENEDDVVVQETNINLDDVPLDS